MDQDPDLHQVSGGVSPDLHQSTTTVNCFDESLHRLEEEHAEFTTKLYDIKFDIHDNDMAHCKDFTSLFTGIETTVNRVDDQFTLLQKFKQTVGPGGIEADQSSVIKGLQANLLLRDQQLAQFCVLYENHKPHFFVGKFFFSIFDLLHTT